MGTTQGSNCVLYNADTQQTMLHKLKCHFRRISQGFEEKQRRKHKLNSLTTKRTTELRNKILSPMPRCSSYITLTMTSSKNEIKSTKRFSPPFKDNKDTVDYEQWKIDFEAARPQIIQRMERKNIFNKLPEALAGQITPNGFPAYTVVATAIAATITIEKEAQQPIKWRTMSMRSNRQNVADKNAVAAKSQSLNTTFTVRRHLSLRLPLLFNGTSYMSKDEKQDENKTVEQQHQSPQRESPKFLSKMSKERANIIEKIYNDIKDLEDYYGTRLDYYYL